MPEIWDEKRKRLVGPYPAWNDICAALERIDEQQRTIEAHAKTILEQQRTIDRMSQNITEMDSEDIARQGRISRLEAALRGEAVGNCVACDDGSAVIKQNGAWMHLGDSHGPYDTPFPCEASPAIWTALEATTRTEKD